MNSRSSGISPCIFFGVFRRTPPPLRFRSLKKITVIGDGSIIMFWIHTVTLFFLILLPPILPG